ncbi:MAG: cytochrome b/b6 domain-containing protein [Lentisphaerae bacterium]|nr:cytochrome b/b6 domain-containing protein [Lentisphaerota bacterium]
MSRWHPRWGMGLVAGMLMALTSATGSTAATVDEDLVNDACFTCHNDAETAPLVVPERYAQSAHGGLQCVQCHRDIAEIPHAEKLAPVDCSVCHKIESEVYLQSDHGRAVSRGADVAAHCRDCHGAGHSILGATVPESPIYRTNIVSTCAVCHADVEKMRQFKLTQTAPVASYEASVHGQAGMSKIGEMAATCTDCHGSHDLHRASHPNSKLFWQRIPETCGKCHENIRRTFDRSVHGAAVASGNHDAPVCTTCHGEHTVDPVASEASKVYPSHITETCGQCHAAERIVSKYNMSEHTVDTYVSSFHGLSLQRGSLTAANCASCHGAHDILPSSDSRSSVYKDSLIETCGRCHPGVSAQVAKGQIHSGTQPGVEHRVVRLVRRIYIWLFIVVLGGMFAHNLLDFIKKMREHYLRSKASGGAPRMHRVERVQHVVLVLSFVALAYTGFALRFPSAWWARPFHGESDWRGIAHRGAAVIFCALSLYHLIYMFGTAKGRRHLKDLWFTGADFVQPFQMFAYYLGWRDHKPKFARFCYIEKAEYWALVWGGIVMTLTGAFMTWEEWAMRLFPKWLYDVANAIHYYEAILACAAIVLWHFYFVMFDPDEYPMKWTWFSGKESEADRTHRDEH